MAENGLSQDEPKHYLIERVRQALAQDGRTNELDVHVTVAGGKIFVTGTVPTQARRDAITEVAGDALPEHEVFNQITVYEVSEPTESEEIQ
jgi:osmotically-inducible protein OsmY